MTHGGQGGSMKWQGSGLVFEGGDSGELAETWAAGWRVEGGRCEVRHDRETEIYTMTQTRTETERIKFW